MKSVFISYAREDIEFVVRLTKDLQAMGLDVWTDANIAGGQDWRDEIQKSIGSCQTLIVVLSPDAVKSEYVRKEYIYALHKKINVIPVMLQSVDIPFELILDNYIDFSGEYAASLLLLIKSIQATDHVITQPLKPIRILQKQSTKVAVTLVVAIIGALGIIIAAIIAYFGAIQPIMLASRFTQTAEVQHTAYALTGTAKVTLIPLHTQTPTVTLPTNTATFQPSQTETQESTATNTPGPTQTPRPSATSTQTATHMPTSTPTVTPSNTLVVVITGDDRKVSSKDNMQQNLVPAGEFSMGHAGGDDNPLHIVYLDAYWIDQTEVTNAQYALCVEVGSCVLPQTNASQTHTNYYGNDTYADYPVVEVSWFQAKSYCHWAGRDLPTEAQWEKAARGTDKRIFPWGTQQLARGLANYGNNFDDTVSVFALPRDSSFYHALMMGGNVSEWTRDWYSETYYSDSAPFYNQNAQNPPGPLTGTFRSTRGSAWNSDFAPSIGARVDIRHNADPHYQSRYIGFRCVEDIP